MAFALGFLALLLLARFIPESAGGAAELVVAVEEARARWAQGY